MELAKYQKVEIIVLGVLVPTLLMFYTMLLLLSGQAIFWGRSATVIYHANNAYFVSLLWFGVSGCMYALFLLRPLKLLNQLTREIFLYISIGLLCIGLISAIVLV